MGDLTQELASLKKYYIYFNIQENGKYGGPHTRVGFPEGLLEIEEEPEKDEKQVIFH